MQSGMHSCQCRQIDISSKICPWITNQHHDFLLIYCKYCLISQPKKKHAFNKNTADSAISSWKRWYIVERCVLLHMLWFQSLEPIILNLAKQPLQNWKHASHDRCKNFYDKFTTSYVPYTILPRTIITSVPPCPQRITNSFSVQSP